MLSILVRGLVKNVNINSVPAAATRIGVGPTLW